MGWVIVAPVSFGAMVFAAQPSDVVDWTALAVLAMVLMGVGKAGWTLINRAEERAVAADAAREKERESDLQERERMITALLESAMGFKQAADVMAEINQGYREMRVTIERLIERR